jgi:TonB family protein
LLPFLHRAPKVRVEADAGEVAKPASPSSAGNETGAGPNTSGSTQPPGNAADVPAANSAASATNSAPATVPGIAPAVSPEIESPAERSALAEKGGIRVAPAKSGAKKTAEQPVKNHGRARTTGESAPAPVAAEVAVSDQPILPAKLLKAVPPSYPPDAMRSYITGDVRIEAEVDRHGHVGAMKILLGPKQFRQVAMDALKQYEYAPATQGGKPVESKVTVTIKFWFDP